MTAIAILSWKSPEILDRTLNTYKQRNLFGNFDEKLIFFQEPSEKDIKIAKKYGLTYLTSEKNIGIENAWRKILSHVNSEQVLMLENDCPVIESEKEIKAQLTTASKLLSSKKTNIVRLRSTSHPGDKFETLKKYQDYYLSKFSILKRIFRPNKAKRLIGSSIYAISDPNKIHPNEIKKYNEHCFITDSSHLNWTNQSVMVNKSFVLDILLERVKTHPSKRALNGFQDIEKALNCSWWRKKKFPIAVCTGIFTHSR